MKPALLLLFDFLLNVVKEIVIKELPQGDPQPVAELLQGNDTGVLAFCIEHDGVCITDHFLNGNTTVHMAPTGLMRKRSNGIAKATSKFQVYR